MVASTPSGENIAVLLPCYNEAVTIEKVVHDFARALPTAKIYVFDNNSTDETAAIAARAGATVIPSRLQGKGNVMRHMAQAVDADIYVVADGDDTYPADIAPALVTFFQDQHLDMLVGARLVEYEHGSFRSFHHLGNRIISGLVSLLFRTQLDDVLSGYRVMSRACVKIIHLRQGGFEVETELTLQALTKRLLVAEVPVPYRKRPEGSFSKLNTWSDGFLILRCIVLLFKDYKPLVFFTTVSILLAAAALISGSAPIADYVKARYVMHVPRAILAAGLGILSLVALTAGLILDTITKLHQENVDFWRQQLGGR